MNLSSSECKKRKYSVDQRNNFFSHCCKKKKILSISFLVIQYKCCQWKCLIISFIKTVLSTCDQHRIKCSVTTSVYWRPWFTADSFCFSLLSVNWHEFLGKDSHWFFHGLVFAFLLLDYIPPKAREPSLPCNLTQSWWEKKWIHPFPKSICTKREHIRLG